MDWVAVPLTSFSAVIVFLIFIFVVARIKQRYDLIDVAWGLLFIAIALVSLMLRGEIVLYSVQTLVTALVVIWGMRLSLHIYARWERSKEEDPRYQAMRRDYAKKPGGVGFNMFIKVFLVQGLLALLIAAPVLAINMCSVTKPGVFAFAGFTVWLIGFLFESIGDYQLKKHLADPKKKGQLMTSGLWRYTRHPNYFGEATQWWGIWIIALGVNHGWVTVFGPITITILLLFISGIPLTEKRFEGRKGWAEYKKRTSVFLPLLPKK